MKDDLRYAVPAIINNVHESYLPLAIPLHPQALYYL